MSPRPDNDRTLYVIPHAGAGAAAVKQLSDELGDRCETFAVRLPGRESRTSESPIADVRELAGHIGREVRVHGAGRRIYLYGHCSGAIMAYEVALLLASHRLHHLVVSSHQAPDRVPVADAWRLPTEQFLSRVADDGYLPKGILADPELVQLVLPALTADYRAIESYGSSTATIDAAILALVGHEEHLVMTEDVAAWGRFTSAGFTFDRLPGGHNVLLDHPSHVAAAIAAIMD